MAEIKSGRVKKTPPGQVSADRYQFLGLSDAEPDLGVPADEGYVLISSSVGVRSWADPSTLTVTSVSPEGNSTTIDTSTSTTTATTPVVIDSTVALAIKYVVHASTTADSEVTEILALARGTAVSHTEYGRISTGSDLASYNVTVNAGSIELRATPASAVSTTYIISKQVMS